MILLVGERIHSRSESAGTQHCRVCSREQHFSRVVETNYFCLFGIRLLALEKLADYLRCDTCNNAFSAEHPDEPSQVAIVKRVLVYIQVGYGLIDHPDIIQDICIKVTGFQLTSEEILAEKRVLGSGAVDVFESLKQAANALNDQGKQQIVEAAFLITHACCEIQYEDRLRINLMGNALGLSLEFVNAVIDQVRAQGCYGVRRLLQTQSKAT